MTLRSESWTVVSRNAVNRGKRVIGDEYYVNDVSFRVKGVKLYR